MKGNNTILKITAVAIFLSLVFASAGYAGNSTNIKTGFSSRAIWEDYFDDASKIDPSPPGSGISDNYVIENGKAKMINTCPAWTDSSWTKMRIINVTNNAGQTLQNYALKLTIDYDSDMQDDYDDIRFKYESDPASYLSYWIESYDSTQAEVWVNIPSLAIGMSELYLFYGKPSANSESDFGSVFSDWDAKWSEDEKVTNHGDQEGAWDPDVCYGNNMFMVCWEEGEYPYIPYNWGYRQELRASIYDTNGNVLVFDQRVFNDGTNYYRNENPSIAHDGDETWFVAWEHYQPVADPDPSTLNIWARTVKKSGSGLELGSEKYVCTAASVQADPNVEFDSVNDHFAVVWEDARYGTSNYNIYGKLYDTAGNQVGGEKTIVSASNTQCEPWMAFDPINEQFMIVWEEGINPENGTFSIKACLFDENLYQVGTVKNIASGSSSIDYNFPCVHFNSEAEEYLITWNSGDISSGDWRGDVWGTILDS